MFGGDDLAEDGRQEQAARTDTSDSWVKDPGAVPVDLRTTDREGELDVDRAVLLGGPRRHGRRGDQLAHRDQVLLVGQALEGATDQLVARRGTHGGESTDRERAP